MVFPIAPILNYRVWGGDYLKAIFAREDISGPVGEVFLLSCMPEAESIIDGLPFSEFYKNHPEYFGLRNEKFPLRINLIDAHDDLSVQLHPLAETLNDPQLPNGIEELWYVIKAEPDSQLILGIDTADKAEVAECFASGNWQSILHYTKVVNNTMAFLPAGLVHAIGKGCLIYELTYNHDITYRLFDYQRIDKKTGLPRAIHKEEGLANLQVDTRGELTACGLENLEVIFNKGPGFCLEKVICSDHLVLPQENFYFYTVIGGSGTIAGLATSLFTTYFVPKTQSLVEFTGNLTFLRTTYNET